MDMTTERFTDTEVEEYRAPAVAVIGSIRDLTAGGYGTPVTDSCNEGIYSSPPAGPIKSP
jgi:hypothetical protein